MSLVHVHLIVNHLPIFAAILAVPLALLALLRRREPGILYATTLVLAVGAMGAVATYFTGEPAEEAVEELPDVSTTWLETHEERALLAIVASVAAAVVAGGASWGASRRGATPTVGGIVAGSGALVASAFLVWAGMAGGQIRHSEIRAEPDRPPIHRSS